MRKIICFLFGHEYLDPSALGLIILPIGRTLVSDTPFGSSRTTRIPLHIFTCIRCKRKVAEYI